MDVTTILIVDSLMTTCSIRETARLQNRAPSTVSAALDRMESALAVSLVRRENATLSLTLEAQKRAALIHETAQHCQKLHAYNVQADSRASISLAALHRFSCVAYTGSIRLAAKNLGLGQPQLTRQLSELERNMGCLLFNRTRSGVSCTDIGKEVLALAEVITNNWEELTYASSDRFRRNLATWRIGSVIPLGHESNIAQILANLTVGWERINPRHPLAISANTSDELMSGLKSRRYDAILIDHANFPKDFDGHIISDTPLALIGDHTVMAELNDDLPAFLRRHRLALPSPQSGIRQQAMQYLEGILGATAPSQIKLMELDSIPVIINLVSRHGYLSILPEQVVARLPFPITQHLLGDKHRQVSSFVWRRNTLPPAVINEILTMLRSET